MRVKIWSSIVWQLCMHCGCLEGLGVPIWRWKTWISMKKQDQGPPPQAIHWDLVQFAKSIFQMGSVLEWLSNDFSFLSSIATFSFSLLIIWHRKNENESSMGNFLKHAISFVWQVVTSTVVGDQLEFGHTVDVLTSLSHSNWPSNFNNIGFFAFFNMWIINHPSSVVPKSKSYSF